MNIPQIGEHRYSLRNIARFNKAAIPHSRAAFGGNHATKVTISPEAQALAEGAGLERFGFMHVIPEERYREILDMLSKELNMNWSSENIETSVISFALNLKDKDAIYGMLDKLFKDEDFKAHFIEQASLSSEELRALDILREDASIDTIINLERKWRGEILLEAWKDGISLEAAVKKYGMEVAEWVVEDDAPNIARTFLDGIETRVQGQPLEDVFGLRDYYKDKQAFNKMHTSLANLEDDMAYDGLSEDKKLLEVMRDSYRFSRTTDKCSQAERVKRFREYAISNYGWKEPKTPIGVPQYHADGSIKTRGIPAGTRLLPTFIGKEGLWSERHGKFIAPADVVEEEEEDEEEEEEIIPQEEKVNDKVELPDKENIIKEFAEQVLEQLLKRSDKFGSANPPRFGDYGEGLHSYEKKGVAKEHIKTGKGLQKSGAPL
jgi:hypothetical protein